MKLSLYATVVCAAAVGACATAERPEGACDAEPAQTFVGQKADAASGLAIRRATGADTLRWGPPRSALTMDFREERVTVAYDDAMTITRITCG